MQITSANLNQLRKQFEKRFHEAYVAAEPKLGPLAMEIPSSTKTNVYGWIAQSVTLREWLGARVAQNLSEHDYSLTNKHFEGTVEIDKDDVQDDNLGMFDSVAIPQLGEAVAKHPEKQIAALLVANPLAFDGLALFHDAHPSFDDAGSTYDNLEASGFALTAVNLAAIQASAAGIVGEDGEPLEIHYTDLFVPPQLEFTAKQILSSATYASLVTGEGAGAVQIENVLAGTMNVHVVPKLAGAATTWYAADLSKTIKPIIRQVRQQPVFVSQDAINDNNVFMFRKFRYGVDLRDAYGVTIPALIRKCVG